jgi:SWI/SNF-related matrix-associated actin-dependent regulator of chromatin subfamily A-like protein 1
MRHHQTDPFPFQRDDLRRVWRRFDGRAIISWDMGLGKTFGALNYAARYLDDDPPGPVVCVVPAHLKLNWKREAEKHLGIRVEILSKQRVPPDKLPPADPNQVYVLNYEILTPPLWRKRQPLPADSWAGWLANLSPRMVAVDEAHRVKNPAAACTRALNRLCKNSPSVLALTGTPLANSPADLWSIVNIVRPGLFPSELEFKIAFTHARKDWWGWTFRGAKDLDVLHRILSTECMVRRRKRDVLHDLPPVTRTVVPVEIDGGEYARAESDFVGWLDDEFPGMARGLGQAQSLAKTGHLKRLAGRLKVDSVVQWVSDFLENTDGKLLLGALHYAVTGPLMDAFRGRAVLVDGTIDGVEKDRRTYRFNHDPKIRLLVGNVTAAGTGWNCTATSDVALCEVPWTPAEVEQFLSRVSGIGRGTGDPVRVWFLVAADTIESDLCEVLDRKQAWAVQAIDGAPGSDPGERIHRLVVRAVRARAAANRA